jgi:hypothetical protein
MTGVRVSQTIYNASSAGPAITAPPSFTAGVMDAREPRKGIFLILGSFARDGRFSRAWKCFEAVLAIHMYLNTREFVANFE